MKTIKDFKLEDIINAVGKVTISFRIKPATKLNLQIAAKKLNVSFALLCEKILEDKLHEITKEPEPEPGTKKTNKNKAKKEIIDTKYNLIKFLEKNFQKQYVKRLVSINQNFLERNATIKLNNDYKLSDSNQSFYVTRINYSQYEVNQK